MPTDRRPRSASAREGNPGPPARSVLGGQSGQASVEYACVLAFLATVLAVTVAVASGAPILNGVIRGFERAICKVTGRDCAHTELAACIVRSRESGGRLGVKLALVKLGGSLTLLREELSDGTVDITLIDGGDAAPTAGLGAAGGVRIGDETVGGGAIAKAELLVRLGRRRVWHRPDGAAADRLTKAIREHVAGGVLGGGKLLRPLRRAVGLDTSLPPPDIVGLSAGAEGAVEAKLGGGVDLKAGLKASLGGSRDRASGRRTFVLALEAETATRLSAVIGAAALTGSAGPTLMVTYDRHNVPVELAVVVAGTASGRLALEQRAPKLTPSRAARVEITSRLDLQGAGNREAYDRLLRGLRTGRPERALVPLGQRMATSARQDLVRYATDSTGYGVEAEAALGARLGGSAEISSTTSELRGAWTRPAGGAWEQRTDCLANATQA